MKKVVISGMIGNALEWYDYALYAQFATIIAKHFFPESDIRDILTFALFAAGFVVRPVGGIVFGYIGDRLGRKQALVLGILIMALPTAGIGLLPGYCTIGIAAPIILAIIRLLQGFSLGGEFSGCIAYIVEHSQGRYRGLAGSASFVSMSMGMILGLGVAGAFMRIMDPQDLEDWGWRIPFVLGLFIGLIGLYIRTHLSESPLYKAAKQRKQLSSRPVRDVFQYHAMALLVATAAYTTVTAPFYTATVLIESFMKTLGYSLKESSLAGTLILFTSLIVVPISAWFSDKIGRKPILISGIILTIVCVYPAFLLIGSMNYHLALVGCIGFAAINAYYMGPVPTVLVEVFPTSIRFTGIALSYNIAAALFGGSAPMIGTMLVKYTGNKYAISYYLMALGLFSLIVLYNYKETYKKDLSAE
ncbi:MFS transporter [Rickettsiales endosymbiont of Paramecium tredecaurelia]|uniref:MFS transporter n=1 Tax=Candidatus Sarmatiella mevalonica TaxID=2770581 RepID=UPI0019207E81|nr:MFS transporter [Candidatus Sarmatiella mevalonica]MBL3285228.1 MFS transporter [Candidatus Sarmatiella mevalonica]